ncbi:MAG: toprim domain-containing protein [Burkholderiales bacterium]|nr:toprim domain-containing protein [Burkholderiales bacterium]
MDNYLQVLQQMEEFGIVLRAKDTPLKLDTERRVTCGEKGKDWYRFYTFQPNAGGTYITGSFGTYRHGGSFQKVEVDWAPLSEAERKRLAAQRDAARAASEVARRHAAAQAAMSAAEWLAAAGRSGRSPYLEAKGLEGESCRYMADGTLVIPMMRYDLPVDERLQAVQRILPNGRKFYTKGFTKPGCAVRLGPAPVLGIDTLLLVCEGYATGLTLRVATDRQYPVFVAFDAGNLVHVVPQLRALYPEARLLICADDDWRTRDPQTGRLSNPGRTVARKVAREVPGCDLVWPVFAGGQRDPKDTDFDDLRQRQGIEVARRQLCGVLNAMERLYG